MKTTEELNAIREQIADLADKLKELSEEELTAVGGGYSRLEYSAFNYELWKDYGTTQSEAGFREQGDKVVPSIVAGAEDAVKAKKHSIVTGLSNAGGSTFPIIK